MKNNIKFDFEDGVTLGLFEDMVKKIETLILLIEKEKSASIDSITRSVMESYVYLKVLLSKENRIYGRSYTASTKLKEISWYNKMTSQDRNGVAIRKLLGKSIDDIEGETDFGNSEERYNKVKSLFADVFERRTEKQKWYNLDGKTNNFEALCKKYDIVAEYEIIYRMFSNDVHGMNAMRWFDFKKNEVNVLIGSRGNDIHISLVNIFLLNTIDGLYNFYGLKDELRKFRTLLKINYLYSK